MNKIQIKVKTNLIDKSRIEKKSYDKKSGEKVEFNEMSLDLFKVKDKTMIASGDTWKLIKIGFVTQTPTKEERESKTQMPIIGDVLEWESLTKQPTFDKDSRGNDL